MKAFLKVYDQWLDTHKALEEEYWESQESKKAEGKIKKKLFETKTSSTKHPALSLSQANLDGLHERVGHKIDAKRKLFLSKEYLEADKLEWQERAFEKPTSKGMNFAGVKKNSYPTLQR